MSRRARAMLAALAIAVAASACSSTTAGPVIVPTEGLPFEIGRRADPAGTAEAVATQRVAFARRGRLVLLPRRIPSDLPTLEAMVRALLAGPTTRETERGIQTLIPTTTRLLGITVTDGIAQVELSEEFQQAASSETLALRVAQVVWTITELPGVIGAAFLIDGEPVAPVNARGESVDRPVTRADYTELSPVR